MFQVTVGGSDYTNWSVYGTDFINGSSTLGSLFTSELAELFSSFHALKMSDALRLMSESHMLHFIAF